MSNSAKRYSGPEQSQRQRRVGESVRHLLAEAFSMGILQHAGLSASITVTEVRVSADLRHAYVYIIPLGGEHIDEVMAAIAQSLKVLRTHVAKNMNLKVAPQLHFEEDKSFEEATKFQEILHNLK